MAFLIEFSEDAERHLDGFSAHGRGIILDAISDQLVHEPTVPTRHRKLLRENPLAAWELRVGEYRVFYDVEEERQAVTVLAIGIKTHSVLRIEGKEFRL
jgi:mRNA-degrading endonuclease RelE of RelBE toxin-antitoxin system